MPNIGDLYFGFRGESKQLEADAKQAGDRAGKTLGERLKRSMSAANIGTGVGAALGGLGVAALKLADKYDKAMDTIRIGTGATGEALDDLEDSFKRVAGEVPDDIETVATVLADLNTRTGQTGEGLETLTKQILDLSRITGTDAATNVANLTRLYGDWSVATEDQSRANDSLFRASQATGIGIDALATSLVSFGAPLRNIGFSLEESTALLAKWEKEGVNTTLALGGLKIALATFAKQGIDAKEGLADLVAQIEEVGPGAEAMALGVTAFGSRAGPDMTAAILEGRFAIEEYVDVIANGEETIASATEATEGFGEQFMKLKNQVSVAVGPIVKDFAGIASSMGNLIFLLPALTGAIGRGLGKTLPKVLARSSNLIKGAGSSMGRTLGTAAASAFALVMVGAAVKIFGDIRDDLRTQADTIVGDVGEIIRTGTDAQLLEAQRAITEGLGNLDSIKDLGIFTGELREKMGSALAAVAEEVEARGISGALTEALSVPRIDTSGIEADVKKALALEESLTFGLRAGQQGQAEARAATVAYLVKATGLHESYVKQALESADGEEAITAALVAGAEARNTQLDQNEQLAITAAKWADAADGTVDGVVRVGEATNTASRRTELLAEALDSLNDTDAQRGLGAIRAEAEELDKTWKDLIKQGDRNKRAIKLLNERIDTWERRYRRAVRNNDSEAADFAAAQLTRATNERDAIQEVVDTVSTLHDELAGLPRKAQVGVDDSDIDDAITKVGRLQQALGSLYGADIDVRLSKPGGGPRGFAGGGPLAAWQPAIVGERGPELFVPDRAGQIYNRSQIAAIAGGESTIHHEHTIDLEGAENLRAAGFDEHGVAALLAGAVSLSESRYTDPRRS